MSKLIKYPLLWISALSFVCLGVAFFIPFEPLRRSCNNTLFLRLFVQSDCVADSSHAYTTYIKIRDSILQKNSWELSGKSWEKELGVDAKFSAVYAESDTYRFALNEGAAGKAMDDVDVLFFLANGDSDLHAGTRKDMWGYKDEFTKLSSEKDVFGLPDAKTLIITTKLELKRLSVQSALKLRWNASDPKPVIPPWDDTKFNGGRKYESERD